MVCGWAWHPVDTIDVFDIGQCFNNPLKLDKGMLSPDFGSFVNTAGFIDDNQVLIGSSDEQPFNDECQPKLPVKSMAVWNLSTNDITEPIPMQQKIGNLFAVNDTYAWDMLKYPQWINFTTGGVEYRFETIDSGIQCSSIMMHDDSSKYPQIRFNRHSGQIAIKTSNSTVDILSALP
jgi:hypothetical protein